MRRWVSQSGWADWRLRALGTTFHVLQRVESRHRSIMSVSEKVKRIVWAQSGGICAFADCGRRLVVDATGGDSAALIGEVAHIVGHSEDGGPRSEYPVPGLDRDGEANLLLLCGEHHTTVDRQPKTYTVERLLAVKESHNAWVREQLVKTPAFAPLPLKMEMVHSTLLAIEKLPAHVYTAPCLLKETEVFGRIRFPRDRGVLLPYVVREKKLIAFTDLADVASPFRDAVSEAGAAERHDVESWLKDDTLSQWLVALLNRTIGKYASLLQLRWDKDHRRYYFEPDRDANDAPIARVVTYRPLNQASSTKQVAWNPVRRKTGEAKTFWTHLAVALRFHRVSPNQWVLSLRPEHRFTKDGFEPISPKGTGKKSTSRKSRMYNADLLGEVQFWRSFLAQGAPRMILTLGSQTLVVDGTLLAADVRWPGVPDDILPFANVDTEDDLFTMSAYAAALSGAENPADTDRDDWELDDIAALEEAHDEEVMTDDDVHAGDSAGADLSADDEAEA